MVDEKLSLLGVTDGDTVRLDDTTNKVLSQVEQYPNIMAASVGTDVWADNTSFDVSSRKTSPSLTWPYYCLKGVHRILAAQNEGIPLTTNNLQHCTALKQMQEICLGQATVPMRPCMTDFVRLTLPRLMTCELVDVLEVRYRLKDFLDPFRAEMCKLLASIPADPATAKVHTEVQRIIDKDVQPHIVELGRYLGNPHRVLRKHLVRVYPD